MPSRRREFLQRLALGAASASVLPAVLRAESGANAMTDRPQEDTFDDLANPLKTDDPAWDTSWTAKITGKHKALFDVPNVSSGAGVVRAGLWAKQYTDVFKATPADLSAVIVLRHNGIILAMNQAFWDEYRVGKHNKVRDGNDKKTDKNPVLAQPLAEGEKARPFDAYMLEQQIARGVVVLACNMAFGGCVRMVMKEDKLSAADARAKAISMLVPGIILQPSGIFANVLAQQTGCAFVAAS